MTKTFSWPHKFWQGSIILCCFYTVYGNISWPLGVTYILGERSGFRITSAEMSSCIKKPQSISGTKSCMEIVFFLKKFYQIAAKIIVITILL